VRELPYVTISTPTVISVLTKTVVSHPDVPRIRNAGRDLFVIRVCERAMHTPMPTEYPISDSPIIGENISKNSPVTTRRNVVILREKKEREANKTKNGVSTGRKLRSVRTHETTSKKKNQKYFIKHYLRNEEN